MRSSRLSNFIDYYFKRKIKQVFVVFFIVTLKTIYYSKHNLSRPQMPKNILLTGGAGFIGSHLADELVNRNYKVKILDNLSSGSIANIEKLLENGKVTFVEGDIRDTKTVKDCMKDVDAVLHLAAQISVTLSIKDPEFNNQVNITGTQNLLDESLRANVAKFVLASSCAVYGEPKYLPVDEQHPTNPISPYAQSKLTAEQSILRHSTNHGLACSVLRFFNVYGPRQKLNDYSGVMTKFIECIKQKQPPNIYGDGLQTRDFVYVADIVAAIILALESKAASGGVFNIGTGHATTINELAKTMLKLTGTDLEINYEQKREGDIKQSYANINKAKILLNYKPKYTLKDGLKTLLKENGFKTKK